MRTFALGWFAVELAIRQGEPALAPLFVGLLGLSQAVPGITLGLLGGVIADRVDRRRLLAYAYGAMAAASAGLAVVAFTGAVGWPVVAVTMALVLASATASVLDLPTAFATLPRLLPPADLMSGIGLTNTTANMAQVAGPLAGGLLIGSIGTGGVIAADVALELAAIVALLRLRPMPPTAVPASVLRSLLEGIRYAVADPIVRWTIMLAAAVGLFGRSVAFVLPAVASTVLHVGAVELSWIMAGRGVGAFLGSLAAASLGGLARRGMAVTVASLVFGVSVLAFSIQTALAPAILLAPAMGAAQFVFSGLAIGLMQSNVPDRLRGRIMSFYTTTVSGVTPLGTFLLGSAGAAIGIGLTDALSGAVLILASTVALLAAAPLRRHRVPASVAP